MLILTAGSDLVDTWRASLSAGRFNPVNIIREIKGVQVFYLMDRLVYRVLWQGLRQKSLHFTCNPFNLRLLDRIKGHKS
jgi:hypothetical protein